MRRAPALALLGALALAACLASCAMKDAEAPAATSSTTVATPEESQNAADEKIVGGDVDDMLSALDSADAPEPAYAPPADDARGPAQGYAKIGAVQPAAPPPPPTSPAAQPGGGSAGLDALFADDGSEGGEAERSETGRFAYGNGEQTRARAERAAGQRAQAQRNKAEERVRSKAATLARELLEDRETDDREDAPIDGDGAIALETEEAEEVEKEAKEEKASRADIDRGFAARGGKGGGKKRKARPPAKPAPRPVVAADGKPEPEPEPDADGDLSRDRFAEMLTGLDETDGRGRRVELAPDDPERFTPPARTLPRVFYFENTYLGGNAAYAERLRRLDAALGDAPRPYRRASLPGQPFDAPTDAGLALTAALDRVSIERPQRVFLQVGLQGSKRYGWRRPPLDVVLVADAALVGEPLVAAVTALMRRLGPQDRVGVIVADETPRPLGPLASVRDQRAVLGRQIEALEATPAPTPRALAAAMREAGAALSRAADDQARIPGSGTVLVLTRATDPAAIADATAAAHALTVQGAITSVIELDGHGAWWPVANAGHGNVHRGDVAGLGALIDAELDSISRVIARLLRVNIRLAPGVEAIRILGSRKLDEREVRQVKAREEATDRNLSKTMGVKADRGDDDDGIQTVIPYFYGGDAHVILVELWVTRPGPVAEVTLKYKDMVELDNATARAAVQLDRVPRPRGPIEKRVAANVRGFRLAEGLADAARHRGSRTVLQALEGLEELAVGPDAAVLAEFERLVRQRGADPTVAEALRMARDRRIGHFER